MTTHEFSAHALRRREPHSLRTAALRALLVVAFLLTHAASAQEAAENAPDPLSEREIIQSRIDAIVAQKESAEPSRLEVEQRKTDLQEELDKFKTSGLAEDPPYMLLLLDGLRDELEVARQRLEALTIVTLSATEAMEAARAQHEQKEQSRRRAKEAAEAAKGAEDAAELQMKLAIAELESRLAEETLELRRIEVADAEVGQEVQRLTIALLEGKVTLVREDVQFTKQELAERLAEIRQREAELGRDVRTAQLNDVYAQERLLEARRELDAATEGVDLLTEDVETRRLGGFRGQENLLVLNKRLERHGEMRGVWEWRFQFYNDEPSTNTQFDWMEKLNARMEQLSRDELLRGHQSAQVREELATLERKLESAADNAELARRLNEQRVHLEGLAGVYESALLSINASKRLNENLIAELQSDDHIFSLEEWAVTLSRGLRAMWYYELATIDDRAITIGKSITGFAFVLLGLFLSSMLGRMLERRLRKRQKLNKDAAAAIRTLVFYMLVIVFTLFALHLANVPLTIFTVMGGAVAIGVGLGSQGIVNNFFSGLFIMAERPFRLGERVVHGGYDGVVEEIGFRGTKIRTLTGHLVTVPNSNLMNESVENIGRRPSIRRLFHLRLRFDTPRDEVRHAVEIVRQVLDAPEICEPIHRKIGGEEFPPRVFFNEFNADSYNLIVIYWFSPPAYWDFLEHSQQVNLRIVEEFETAGIVLALPAQTLHLEGDAKS